MYTFTFQVLQILIFLIPRKTKRRHYDKKQIVWTRKEYGKLIGLTLFGICLIILPANLFAQQGNINSTETENAAVYYSKAFDLLEYPKSEVIKTQLQEVVKNGWQKEYKGLEKILAENESCFDEFKKGLKLEECDFNFSKEYKYLIQKEIPNLLKVRNLSNLLLLKGRYYEKQKDFDEAVNIYLSSLRFAQHISQDNTVSKMIAIAIEKEAYAPLKQYLDSEKVEKETRLRILNYLTKYEKEHFSAKELVEVEKDFFISNIKMLADEAEQQAEKDSKFNVEKKKTMEALGEEMISQAQELANRYYGNFAKAIETNNEKDWEFAINELDSLQKTLKSPISNIKDVSSLLYDAFTKDVEGSKITIARKIVTITLAISIPNFRRAAEHYYLTLKELKEAESLANINLR